MTPATTMPATDQRRSRLRLIASKTAPKTGREAAARVVLADPTPCGDTSTNVLVAGADSARRSRMLGELRGLLPNGTPFAEARETWEVLSRAGDSRMVILTGDLDDISAQGLMRVLGRRYPLLPVIALSGGRRAASAGDVGVLSL